MSDAFGIACDEFVSSWSFGVHTRADEPDVALGYHVVADESGVNWEYIPASRMVHIKRNVPRNAKRGFSDFYPIEADATRGEKLRRNMAEGAAVQSAIAYVRQHVQGATRVGVEQMLGENKVGTSQQQLPMGGSRSRNVVQYRPGTVVDLSAGLEYKPGPMGSDRANDFMVVAQYVQRMQAIRWSMPEYMFTGDASNANYSSTLVAESPFVKSCEAEQRFYSRHFVSVIWKALQIRWELGAFEQFGVTWEELEQLIEIKAECPAVATRDELANVQRQEILIRLGVMSRKTAASQNGLDYEAEVALGAMPADQGSDQGQDPGGETEKSMDDHDDFVSSERHEISEQLLFECGGRGGKPGPCPGGHRKVPTIAHSRNKKQKNQLASPATRKRAKSAAGGQAGASSAAKGKHSKSSKATSTKGLKNRSKTKVPQSRVPHSEPIPLPLEGEIKARAANTKLNTKPRQQYALKHQRILAKKLGGQNVEGNAPADFALKGGMGEVKVIMDRDGHRIYIKKDALYRKARDAAEAGHPYHLFVMDKRNVYDSGAASSNYSGHDLYYRRGVSSGDIRGFERVLGTKHAKDLAAMADDELPQAARPTAEWKKVVAKAATWKKKGKLRSIRAIRAQQAANEWSKQ